MGTEILIGLAISAATSIATSLLAPKQTLLPVDKGRYDDIRVQGSEYGSAIPIVYGRARLAGNILYSDGVQPHVTTTPGRPGGKLGGGGRPPEPPVNHYSYTTNLAIGICEGEVKGGLKRMWENAKVTMGTDTNPLPDGTTKEAELTTNILTGDVQIARDLAASGEYKVFLNGANSAVAIPGFDVPQAGNYNIKIIYMGLGAKTAEVFVNNVTKGIISFGSTGSDNVSQVKLIAHNFATTGTYEIKIKRNGSNPAPYIDAVGLYGATAAATVGISAGAVVNPVTITDGGGGYTIAPLIRFFGGGGSGATATATVTNGVITGINVTAGGSGYTTAPTVDIMPSVVFTPSNVSGLTNPELPYNPNPDYQYQYYNNSLTPDANGTSSAGLERSVTNNREYPEQPTNPTGTGGGGSQTTTFGSFTYYSGSETQVPDPFLLTLEPGNVPGYRGTSYLVLKNYQIPDGQMPNFTFEVEEGTHNLANILISLWARVGLDASLLDVAALDGVFVEGLVVNTRTPLSDILEALAIAYAFDFVDLNGKVTAVKRGNTPVAVIYESELKAHEDGSEVPVASLEATYVDVKELPKQIDVSYMDRSRSYYQNVQPAVKQIGANEEPQTLVLPLVLPSAQAKEIGLRVLNTIYLQKAQYSFSLSPKYSWLSPTDVVTLVMNNATHTLRVSQFQTGMPGLCKVQAVPDSASLYLDAVFASTIGGAETPIIPFPAVTQCVFMDIPPLLPEHSGFGFYAAACGSGIGTWDGAHLYREESINSNTWLRLGSFEVPSILGVTGTALANTTGNTDIGGGRMIDTLSSITVSLYTGTLETHTNLELFNNPNLNFAYIGKELVQFATVSSVATASSPFVRRYTLTNFRRGLNGTTSKVGGHSANEEFVLLDSSAQWMRIPAGSLFTDYRYKVASVGVPLQGVQPIVFNTGAGSAPPLATNLVCNTFEVIAQDGTTSIVIRGTFNFGTFAGGQRAKILVRRPIAGGTTEATYSNTGIIVSPDASNNGGFELPAAIQGTYFIQVVTMSAFDLTAPSGHPIAQLVVTADTTPPPTPTIPVATFDNQMVTWTWTQSTAPNHSYYKFYNGNGTLIAARVDGNTYTEYPVSGMTRKVTAVNATGVESLFSPTGTFTLPPPSPPTSYNTVFTGAELLHSWVAPTGATTQFSYEIADGVPTVLGTSSTTGWIESTVPASRSFTRQVRAKNFGITSTWVTTTVSIPAPAAPTSVAFDLEGRTPFDVPVLIEPNASMNLRQIVRTVVEVTNSTGATILQTLYFSGVARTINVSGRFLDAPNNVIKVRARYQDFIDDTGGNTITTDTYTFPAIAGTDIGNNTIQGSHILQNGSIIGAHIGGGILNTAHFATSIRPIEIYSGASLPTLPAVAYPVGATLYWTVDSKQYQNRNNATWTDTSGATTFGQLTGTILAGQIGNGTITDNHIDEASRFSQMIRSNMQATWRGGGDITWNQTGGNAGLTWTNRFISLPNALSSSGFIEFSPKTNLAITASWTGLYRRFQIGQASSLGENTVTTVNPATLVAGYFTTLDTSYVPPTNLTSSGFVDYLIGYVDGDSPARFILWDGRIINNGQTLRNNTSVPVGGISTEQLIAGSITAAKIQAGAITAEKLAVGLQVGNLVINPSMENTYTVIAGDYYNVGGVSVGTIVPEGWLSTSNNVTAVTAASQGIVASDGNYVLKMIAASANAKSKGMPVTPGATYLFRFSAYGSGVTTGFYCQIVQGTSLDANGYTVAASTVNLENNIALPATWGDYGTPRVAPYYYTVPAGVTYISISFANTVVGTAFIDEVVVTKQLGSTYIQNGAITTDLIQAGAVRAQHMQVGTFSESLQLNSKFVDGAAGYYHTVSSGSNGTQIIIPSSPAATDYSTGSDSSIPSEWTNITAVPYLQIPNTNPTLYGNWVPLDVNDTYYIETWVRTTSGTSTVSAGVYTDAGNFTGRVFASVSVGTTWTKLSGVVGKTGTGANYKAWNDTTLGASTKFRFYVTSTGGVNVRFAQVLISRMQTGNLMVNGAITAQHIIAGGITAGDIIAGGTISGSLIQAGAISAFQISAGAIRADKIAIGVIQNNLILNSSFENFSPTPYNASTSRPIGWAVVEIPTAGTQDWNVFNGTPSAAEGSYSLRLTGSGTYDIGSTVTPITAGKKYIIRYKFNTAATAGNFGLFINYLSTTPLAEGTRYIGGAALSADVQVRDNYDIGLVNFSNNVSVFNQPLTSTAGEWVTREVVWTPSSGIKYASLSFRIAGANSPVYLDEVDVKREVTGVIIEDGTLTANKLVAQTITGDYIQAGTLTVDKFATRVLADNLLYNPGFESRNAATSEPLNWAWINGSAPTTFQSASDTDAADGAYALKLLNTAGTVTDVGSEAIPVATGEVYYVSFRAKVPVATAGTFAAGIFESNVVLSTGKRYVGLASVNPALIQDYTGFSWFTDIASGQVFDGDTTSTYMTTAWKRFEFEYTVPPNVKFVSFFVRQTSGTNPIYWDSMVVRKFVPGVTIENGTITAPKIRAGSITAEKLAIGAFGDNQIANPSLELYNSTSFLPDAWKVTDGTVQFTSQATANADGVVAGGINNNAFGTISSSVFPVSDASTYVIRFKVKTSVTTGILSCTVGEYNATLPANVRYMSWDAASAGDTVVKTSYKPMINSYPPRPANMITNLETVNNSLTGSLGNISAGNWIQIECVYTPTSGTKFAALLFRTHTTLGNGYIYIDDFIAQKKTSGVFIENGTITAENLVIGGMSDNMLPNGSFELLDRVNEFPELWSYYNVTGATTVLDNGTGGRYLRIPANISAGVTSRVIPVVPGTKIAARFQAKGATAGIATSFNFLFRATMPSTGSDISRYFIGTGSEVAPNTTSAYGTFVTHSFITAIAPTYYEALITVPAGMYWMSISPTAFTTQTDYDDITIKKQVGQAFISDLRADQIVANTAQIGLVFADQIKQVDFTPYQLGSSYTPDLFYLYGSHASYDLPANTINVTTSEAATANTVWSSDTWQKIKAGTNGYVEFVVPNNWTTSKSAWVGLTANWNPASYASGSAQYALDYAWYIYGPTFNGSNLFIFEADQNSLAVGNIVAGDVLRIAIEEDYVRFRRNGLMIWTSPYRPSTGTIRNGTRNGVTLNTVNPEFRLGGVTVANAGTQTVSILAPKIVQEGVGKGWRLNPLAGSSLYSDEPIWDTAYDTGNIASNIQIGTYLQRTAAAAAWDTSAVTTQQILAGDGWFQTTITNITTNGNSFLGLTSNSDWANPSITPHVTYGLFFDASGTNTEIWENGVGTGVALGVGINDTFRISLEGGRIKYLKNGAVFNEKVVTATYPIRGKVWLNSPNAKLDRLLFTSASSGLGEFNSGVTVRGKRIEEIVKLTTQALRGDNRYRGNDFTVPSSVVTSIKYDSYHVAWEDDMCFMNISAIVGDYKTNNTRNFDSVKHVRARIYNKYGELVDQVEAPFHGRGSAFSGYFPRIACDGKQEAVFSFEFENLYGYSVPVWYSEAGWLDKTTDTWIESGQHVDISYTAPIWFNRNDIPTNCKAVPTSTSAIQVTWTKAANGAAWTYQVYYRIFKPEGYEGNASGEGWVATPTTTTDAFQAVTVGILSDTRYEFMVKGTTIAYGWSNIAHVRTFTVLPAPASLGAPSSLSGSAVSSTQINLTWVKNDTTSPSYIETELWRTSAAVGSVPAIPTEASTQVGSLQTGTSYSNTGLTENTVYSYRSRNKYTGPVYSEWSNVTTTTTPLTTATTPPTSVSVASNGFYSVSVTFIGNNGGATYVVQLALEGDESFASPVYNTGVGVNGSNVRFIYGLIPGTVYIARVQASGSTWSSLAYGSTTETRDGDGCVLETEPITVVTSENVAQEIEAGTLKVGDRVLGSEAGSRGVVPAYVSRIQRLISDGLLHITTASGANVKCSLSHKPIRNWKDETGLSAHKLVVGDSVLVYNKDTYSVIEDEIVSIEYIAGQFNIIKLSLESQDHTYISGGIFAHNTKIEY